MPGTFGRKVSLSETLHASCIALNGRAALILGPSGSGKSTLALELMALGADLVADDRTELARDGDQIIAGAPAAIRGLIEARHMGLLRAPAVTAPVVVVVDLATTETDRLPPPRNITLLGLPRPLLWQPASGHLGPKLLQWLKAGPAPV